MRIRQEIVLGMAGVNLLKTLELNPTVYHMNEGHSAFLILELIKNIIKEKKFLLKLQKILQAQKQYLQHIHQYQQEMTYSQLN